MRECRKCGTQIPFWVKIEGKRKSLKSRKFCLLCSPYRGHNTKTGGPESPYYRKGKYSQWSEKAKRANRDNIYKRGLRRKKQLVDLSGGVCIRCGYNKSLRALTFHHRKPKEKLFGLSVNRLWALSWEKILEEHKKCDLLCMNCHAEIEEIEKSKDPTSCFNLFN